MWENSVLDMNHNSVYHSVHNSVHGSYGYVLVEMHIRQGGYAPVIVSVKPGPLPRACGGSKQAVRGVQQYPGLKEL